MRAERDITSDLDSLEGPQSPPGAQLATAEPKAAQPHAVDSHGAEREAAAPGPDRPSLADIAGQAGLKRIHMLAWRDFDDPEAGGSELHAHRVAAQWASAGLDVTVRTSHAAGHPSHGERDGYRVVRKAGRYAVFPRTAISGRLGRSGPRDGLVEIWNGMPFFSPLWAGCPRVVFLHHVHAEMWRMVLSPHLARLGELVELKLAPPVYRGSRIVTLSESSKAEIVELLGLPAANIDVVPPGIDSCFRPGGVRSQRPLVVAVGRLVPVKRHDVLIDALVRLRSRHPTLQAVIAGEGYERPALQARIAGAGAGDWLALPGHLDDGAVVDLYRRAWVVASASSREGWGMTVTEAAACGTPAVATRIAGHVDAVVEGRSGLLAGGEAELESHLDAVLRDADLRRRLSEGALTQAAELSWQATARGTLTALVGEVRRCAASRGRAGSGLSQV